MTLTNYWWLLIWLFTGGLALAAYFPKHREMVCGKIETRWGVVPAVLMVVPYIVWAGYRSDAFGDTAAYRGAFKDAPSSFSEMSAYLDTIMKDKGFYGLVAALKSLFHVSDIGCFMLLAGFQLLVIVWLYRKYSSFYWFSFFLFIASTDYMSWAQNGVRQFLAVTIALLATPFMLKKKYIPAILLIILASTMHQSALLMIAMSCRVAGKYVESALFAELLQMENCKSGEFRISITKKNILLRNTLEEIGFLTEQKSVNHIKYQYGNKLIYSDLVKVEKEL